MNNYIICFWDKSKIQVSEEMGNKLKQAIATESIKTFEIGNSLYAVSGVEKIIPKEEAYLVFPEENGYLQTLETKQPKFQALNQDNNQKQLE